MICQIRDGKVPLFTWILPVQQKIPGFYLDFTWDTWNPGIFQIQVESGNFYPCPANPPGKKNWKVTCKNLQVNLRQPVFIFMI